MSGKGVTSIFRDYGYRRLRSRARLKFLVADWGVEKFREVLEKENLGREPSPATRRRPLTGHRDHVGVHEQKDGNYYIGIAPIAGRISGAKLGRARRPHGAVRRRGCPPHAVPEDRADRRHAGPGGAVGGRTGRHRPAGPPSQWRQNTMACTGIEFCKLAIVETKARARDLVESSSGASPDWTSRSRSTSTAAPTPAPAPRWPTSASRAELVMHEGEQVGGFQVHLGGATAAGQLRPQARAHKVTSEGL